jgi:3-phenylpropionate/trans-cinnamate dioxygenase ferredoxin reductase subunit
MVIVGAGQAGGRAALTLRELGHAGPIVLLGAEGRAPYERPPLSKAFLRGERAAEEFTFAKPATLADAGVDFRPGASAVAVDRARRTVRLADGEEVPYARLLLATGREPRRLPIDERVAPRVHVLRDLADAERLKAALTPGARLAIFGGGFVGLEVAASAVELGARPTVIELAPRLLARAVPAELAAVLQARHEAAGVEILLGTGPRSIDPGPDGGVLLRLDDGREGRAVAADAVLVGIGAVPRTRLAEAAGLAVDEGIVVDATLATCDPDVFAAGDVAAFANGSPGRLTRLESWANAEAQGALAARNMLGGAEAHDVLPWFWSDQHELTLQIVGHPERGVRTVERRVVGADGRLLFHLDVDGRLAAVSGVGPASLAREFKLAQMLLERGGPAPDPTALADPATRLKALLR